MGALPKGFLQKKGGKWRSVSLFNLAILLYHVHRGAEEESVGFEDAQETLDTLTRKLSKTVFVEPAVLESALWSANLMEEAGEWWHPRGLTFDEWVREVLPGVKFNRIYNVIEGSKE